MAMAGMAGTAVAVALAVLKEKADRRSFKREIGDDEVEEKALDEAGQDDGETDNGGRAAASSDEPETKDG